MAVVFPVPGRACRSLAVSPETARKIALYLKYIAFVLEREAGVLPKIECGYCQSTEPCFNGKTTAGHPCQHPNFKGPTE